MESSSELSALKVKHQHNMLMIPHMIQNEESLQVNDHLNKSPSVRPVPSLLCAAIDCRQDWT